MIVVLAEKPSVGRDLARILGAKRRCEGYLEGNGYIVTWAFGHLVELVEPDAYDAAFKSWNLKSLPIIPDQFRLKASSSRGVKQQLALIKKLLTAADSVICATDAGREGELIFRYIQQFCRCKTKPAQRLWISSMTDSAIADGFRNLKPLSDYDNLAAAARCRSESDWIVGLNATRAYTVQYSHGRGVLSVGRVQTPILALIVRRDQEIRNFKPEDYWEVWTVYRDVRFKNIKERFKVKEEGEALVAKVATAPFCITGIEGKKTSQPPPQLFDLTELQRAMNRTHGFSASQTLQCAQALYEKKLISYPRTDSRYLTEDLYPACGKTLEQLKKQPSCTERIAPLDLQNLSRNRRIFNNAKVTDHHAMIPTGQSSAGLGRDEGCVYNAVVTRFIAVFYPNCEKAHTTVLGEANTEFFKAKGTRIISPGWFALYQTEERKKKEEEQILPAFEQGESGTHKPELKACRTQPPKHYTEATLLSAMETAGKTVDDEELREAMKDRGLGTPATRAAMIETLLKREYIQKKQKTLLATEKGEDVIGILENQGTLTSAELTADWEFQLRQVEKGLLSADDFMKRVRDFTAEIIAALKGGTASSALGRCPLCSEPVIQGRVGFGCSAWKSGCPFRFHAEQFGTKLDEQCVRALLHRGRITYPRKLTDSTGQTVQGYITIDAQGQLGMMSRDAKISEEALGSCPQCGGSVIEKGKCYSCLDCDFVIWKTIARRKISKTLAAVLMSKGKTQTLKGFRSKAGKPFSASLTLKEGKVVFAFS